MQFWADLMDFLLSKNNNKHLRFDTERTEQKTKQRQKLFRKQEYVLYNE